MASPTLITPSLVPPKKLAALAAMLIERRKPAAGDRPRFPLKNMREIFEAYATGETRGLFPIDQFRLAMALIVNLHTILEGKEERYQDLCREYLPRAEFVEAVFREARNEDVFSLYLQKLFLRHEVVRKPHLDFMEGFYSRAVDDGAIPHKLELLVKIRENKRGFLKGIVDKCLTLGQAPARVWGSFELIHDNYVEEKYIQPSEELLLKELIKPGVKHEPDRLKKLLTLLLNFGATDSTLTRRFEHVVFAAEGNEQLREAFLEIVQRHLKTPPNWGLLPGVTTEAIRAYERLCGLAEFQYFEVIAQAIYENFRFENESDRKRLRNRTFFWMNYRHKISAVKIFLTEESYKVITSRFDYYNEKYFITEELLGKCGKTILNTEVVFLLIKDVVVIEFFRGSNWDTQVLDNGVKRFANIRLLRELRRGYLQQYTQAADYFVCHKYLWQNALMNVLLERHGIDPDKGTITVAKGDSPNFRDSFEVPKAGAMQKETSKIKENYGSYAGLLSEVIQEKKDILFVHR
jgi:hypothetical protein